MLNTEVLEEWQIDQMVEEVFGESASGFEAAGLSEEEQDAYWQRKKNREKNRKNSKTPSKRPVPARPNPFSTEGLEEWQIDQMVEEIFGESESGLEAAGLSKEAQDAYWQRNGGKPGTPIISANVSEEAQTVELTEAELGELTETVAAMMDGEKTLEEVYAQDPSRFRKWLRYLGYSAGSGLAWFNDLFWSVPEYLIGKPMKLLTGQDNLFTDFAQMSEQSWEWYQQRADAATAAMGDSPNWQIGQTAGQFIGLGIPAAVLANMVIALSGKTFAHTSASTLRDYKIPIPYPDSAKIVSEVSDALLDDVRFAYKPMAHMGKSVRYVPVQILQHAIRTGQSQPDPRGSSGLMYYSIMERNGVQYNLEVLYDRASNMILHYKYTQNPLGPLPKIPRS